MVSVSTWKPCGEDERVIRFSCHRMAMYCKYKERVVLNLPEQGASWGGAVCPGRRLHGEEFCPMCSLRHKEQGQESLHVQGAHRWAQLITLSTKFRRPHFNTCLSRFPGSSQPWTQNLLNNSHPGVLSNTAEQVNNTCEVSGFYLIWNSYYKNVIFKEQNKNGTLAARRFVHLFNN